MERQQILDWVREQYGTEPEYPWRDDNAVLRHKDNKKWYGVLLRVPCYKLGLSGNEMAEILNVKADPILIGALLSQTGFFPAYHMNKEKWVSILLGDSDLDGVIQNLLDLSYELTKSRTKQSRGVK